MSKPGLKTAFSKAHVIEPLHTGGPVASTSDANYLFTSLDQVILIQADSGKRICSFSGDTSQITAIAVSSSSKYLATFGESFLLSIFELNDSLAELSETIHPVHKVNRSHDAPVHVATVDPSSSYLASGSADGIVKVWDLRRGFATHSFKGHSGVISAITFHSPSHNDPRHLRVITASVDTKIHIYEMAPGSTSSRPLHVLEGHSSVPRGLAVSEDGKWLLSGGRDGLVLLWDYEGRLRQGHSKAGHVVQPKTLPVFERVETLGILNGGAGQTPGVLTFYVGGEKGLISIWEAHTGKKIGTLTGVGPVTHGAGSAIRPEIVDIIATASGTLISVHADQNIFFYSGSPLQQRRCIIGYNDEIIDSALLSSSHDKDTQLALATNSSLIRLYSMSDFNSRLLSGHTDIVLCIKASLSGRLLGSGAKDNTALLWRCPDGDDMGWSSIAVCEGHTESVGSIAFPNNLADTMKGVPYCFTGSQDRTIKMWDTSSLPGQDGRIVKLKTLMTIKAHDKDINALDVSPDNNFLASGSQDKTVKVFQIRHTQNKTGYNGELKLVGTLKGHKRGVWDVKFHPSERVIATASGDKTIRLWSMDDSTCVKTLEEHTNSVLRIYFLNRGTQIASSASDGLVKIWNINEERCITTLDNHEDKVWALSITSNEKKIVSGAGDSVVTIWEDVTAEKAAERESERTAMALQEQSFSNYVAVNDYRNAFVLALAMDQPGRLLNLFRHLTSDAGASSGSITGNQRVDEIILTLSYEDLAKLLRHVRTWNASSKTSEVAQRVLYAILKLRRHEDLRELEAAVVKLDNENPSRNARKSQGALGSSRMRELVESLIPYTERHLHRLDRLVQESYVIDHIIGEMDDGLIDIDQDVTLV